MKFAGPLCAISAKTSTVDDGAPPMVRFKVGSGMRCPFAIPCLRAWERGCIRALHYRQVFTR
jgi:hypothetical protein